ncbi:MAG: hypothetical protein P4L26_11840, partial [Terracidiphilus sp.]|nr:hypothetical protein [Terracidiphilus sp.]
MLIFPPLYKMREGEEGYRGAQCLGLRALQRHGFAGTLPRGFDHRDLLDYRSDSDVFDSRTGTPSIIDMRGVKLPTKKHDCESFEFSRVKQIAAGHLREDLAQNYLAAWVGDEIYVYLIRGV